MNFKAILFENKGLKQTIFKNTFWLAVSQIFIRLLKLVLIIYVARLLSVAEYGEFNYALSFVSLFVIMADLGINNITIREFSKDRDNEKDFSALLSFKFVLAIFTILLIGIVSLFTIATKTIFILGLYVAVLSFGGIFSTVFQAREKLQYYAWGDMIQGVVVVALGILFITFNPSAEFLALAYLISVIVLFVYFAYVYTKYFSKIKIRFDTKVWKEYFSMAWPLALAGMFGHIYTSIDSVMIEWFYKFDQVAYYNAAQKFIWIALIPASLISTSFFPTFNKLIKESKEKMQKIWSFQLETMFALALPVILGTYLMAEKIIDFGFGLDKYEPSVFAMQILLVMLFFAYISMPFHHALISFDKQKKIFLITMFGAILNFFFNLLLIPIYGFYGAAWATAGTYLFVLIVNIYYLRKLVPIDIINKNLILTILISIVSCIFMYYVLINPLVYSLHIFLIVLISMISYFSVYFILRKYIL